MVQKNREISVNPCRIFFRLLITSICSLCYFLLTDLDFFNIIQIEYFAFYGPFGACLKKKLINFHFFLEFVLTPNVY